MMVDATVVVGRSVVDVVSIFFAVVVFMKVVVTCFVIGFVVGLNVLVV